MSNLLKRAMEAFNAMTPEQQVIMLEETRKSFAENNVALSRPAAPVEGLERYDLDYHDICGEAAFIGRDYDGQYVRFDQAEAIIAALKSDVAGSSSVIEHLTQRAEKAETDNAALTARIEFLERVWKKAESHTEALETQLAAAKEAHKSLFGDKTMEGILWPDVKPTDLITIRVQKQIYDKARAALEAKP